MADNKFPAESVKAYKERIDGYHKMKKDLEKKDTGMTVKEMVDELVEDLLHADNFDDIVKIKKKLVNRIKNI